MPVTNFRPWLSDASDAATPRLIDKSNQSLASLLIWGFENSPGEWKMMIGLVA
jgi:hypothetical protein